MHVSCDVVVTYVGRYFYGSLIVSSRQNRREDEENIEIGEREGNEEFEPRWREKIDILMDVRGPNSVEMTAIPPNCQPLPVTG